jgi:hypothetical protein
VRVPIAIVVGVVAVLLGRAIVGGLFGTDLSMPDAIAGVPRDSSTSSQRFEDAAKQEFGREDLHASVAAYGTAGPEYFVIALDHPNPDADEAFQTYARGFMTGATGTTVDIEGRTTSEGDGATYICADMTGSLTGTLCMWSTEDVTGYVHAIGKEQAETLAFTRQAGSLVGS